MKSKKCVNLITKYTVPRPIDKSDFVDKQLATPKPTNATSRRRNSSWGPTRPIVAADWNESVSQNGTPQLLSRREALAEPAFDVGDTVFIGDKAPFDRARVTKVHVNTLTPTYDVRFDDDSKFFNAPVKESVLKSPTHLKVVQQLKKNRVYEHDLHEHAGYIDSDGELHPDSEDETNTRSEFSKACMKKVAVAAARCAVGKAHPGESVGTDRPRTPPPTIERAVPPDPRVAYKEAVRRQREKASKPSSLPYVVVDPQRWIESCECFATVEDMKYMEHLSDQTTEDLESVAKKLRHKRDEPSLPLMYIEHVVKKRLVDRAED